MIPAKDSKLNWTKNTDCLGEDTIQGTLQYGMKKILN